MHVRHWCQEGGRLLNVWSTGLKKSRLEIEIWESGIFVGFKDCLCGLEPHSTLCFFSPPINIGVFPLYVSVFPSRLRVGIISGSSVLDTEEILHKQAVELLAVKRQEAKGGIWSGSRHRGRAGEPGKWAGCVGKGRAGPLRSHLGRLRGRRDAGSTEEPSEKRRLVPSGSRLPLPSGVWFSGGSVDGLVRIVPTPPTTHPPALALRAHGDVIWITHALKYDRNSRLFCYQSFICWCKSENLGAWDHKSAFKCPELCLSGSVKDTLKSLLPEEDNHSADDRNIPTATKALAQARCLLQELLPDSPFFLSGIWHRCQLLKSLRSHTWTSGGGSGGDTPGSQSSGLLLNLLTFNPHGGHGTPRNSPKPDFLKLKGESGRSVSYILLLNNLNIAGGGTVIMFPKWEKDG